MTKEQFRQMLQSLAADRFKLKVSRVTREVDGTALLVAKGGLKIHEVTTEEPLARLNKMPQGRIEVGITGKATMKGFAENLSFSFPTPDKRFVDMTGLTGIYAINLFYSFAIPPPPDGGGRGAEAVIQARWLFPNSERLCRSN